MPRDRYQEQARSRIRFNSQPIRLKKTESNTPFSSPEAIRRGLAEWMASSFAKQYCLLTAKTTDYGRLTFRDLIAAAKAAKII